MKPGLAAADQQFEQKIIAACIGPEGQTPSMAITPDHGKLPAQVVVTGRNWPPDQQLEITGFAGALDRADADSNGRFNKTVTLQAFPGGGPPTITVRHRLTASAYQQTRTDRHAVWQDVTLGGVCR